MFGSGYAFLALQQWLQALYAASNPGQGLVIVPYGYTATFAALAQNATQTQIVNITANADFVLTAIRHRAQIGAAQTVSNKTAPFVRMLVTDTGSNEQFTAQAVDLENYSQNGDAVQSLPFPRFIGGRTSLTVQATNYAPTAETYTTLDVFFEGVLVRTYSPAYQGAQPR